MLASHHERSQMPIIERDPWRLQYFEGVECPDDLIVPVEDPDAYSLFPEHRWVYNKLLICDTQGLPNGPHGLDPPAFPVFSKPIYTMRGMGIGSRVIASAEEYGAALTAGHMWMPVLTGEHVSSDAAVVDGEPVWWRHTTGTALAEGTFDHWTVGAEAKPLLEQRLGDWLRRNLRGYTGMINLESIDATIIECHLRFADQWPDLYGRGFVESVIELYADGRWSYADADRRTGYSVVLFGGHGPRYRKVDPAVVREVLALPGVSSVQITFHEDKPPEQHAMPPGGFRLAIVNCWDLDAGIRGREILALAFWSAQRLRPQARGGAAAS